MLFPTTWVGRVAFGKLQAMVGGAQIIRSQLEREQAKGAKPATSQ
jgi:hypothetical protein